MPPKEPFLNWKSKLGILALVLTIFFFIFDLAGLSVINQTVQQAGLDQYHLYAVKNILFNSFMFQVLRLLLTIGLCCAVIFWILTPYWRLTKDIKELARKHPDLKPLVKGTVNELGQAEEVIKSVAEKWRESSKQAE